LKPNASFGGVIVDFCAASEPEDTARIRTRPGRRPCMGGFYAQKVGPEWVPLKPHPKLPGSRLSGPGHPIGTLAGRDAAGLGERLQIDDGDVVLAVDGHVRARAVRLH